MSTSSPNIGWRGAISLSNIPVIRKLVLFAPGWSWILRHYVDCYLLQTRPVGFESEPPLQGSMQSPALRASSAPLCKARVSHTLHSWPDFRWFRDVLSKNNREPFVCFSELGGRTDVCVQATHRSVVSKRTQKCLTQIIDDKYLQERVRIGCTRIEGGSAEIWKLFHLPE